MNQKPINSTNILIVVLITLIVIFLLGIFFIIYKTIQNPKVLSEPMINLAGTLSSLIVASVSVIALLVNRKNTLETIKQNENNLFIQLRYEKAHKAINKLNNEIVLTLGLYEQIQDLNKKNIPAKKEYLSPRAFLVMQFINIISDDELLVGLPISLRAKLENNLINKFDKNYSGIRDNKKFSRMLDELNFERDYEEQFNILKSDYPNYKISNSIKYNQFIKKFNDYEDYEMHEHVFMYYYGCKKIKTEDIYNHLNNILHESESNSTEYLILKDKLE